MSTSPHSRLIHQAAKEVLAPIGLVQKGQSRIWLDDQNWFVIVVEFQPSSWSKGSYLNVGAMWLWKEQDCFSFDVGHRVEGHSPFKSEEQFAPRARDLAEKAREEVLKLRNQFPSIEPAAAFLREQARTSHNPHQLLDAAIALGYIGRASTRVPSSRKLRNRTQSMTGRKHYNKEPQGWQTSWMTPRHSGARSMRLFDAPVHS